jgi:lysophospholipase L1-like esterase
MKKIIFFNLIIFFFLILGGELILRIFKISQLMGIDSNVIVFKNDSHYLNPNSTGYIFSKEVFIDKEGNRVPELNKNLNQKKNIVMVGDSVTFGNGVKEENTFVGLLRKKYNNYNFLNTAVPGYDLLQHEKNLTKISNYKNVEKIFYFLTLNDVLRSQTIVPWHNRNKKKLEQELGILQKIIQNKYLRNINYYLRNKSYIFMYIKGTVTDPSKRWYKNVEIFYLENEIDHLSIYLKKLIEISIQKNSKLNLVILPYEYQTRSCAEDTKLIPQVKIKEQLYKLNINYFDFYKDFCKYKKPKSLFYKFDPMHLSIKGHKKVFELIDREIIF